MEDKIGIEIPDPQTDYHGHPKYGRVFLRLLLLAATSIVCGLLFPPAVSISIIFLIAVIQAGLVLRNFMHMKYEPLLIWIISISILFTLFMLFYGVYTDITPVVREIAK